METFSVYKIIEKIHNGRKSVIYRAVRQDDKTPVIIKLLKSRHPNSLEISSLWREYEIAERINSERIVRPLGIEHSNDYVGLIFEDFGGESLDRILIDDNRSIREFIEIAIRLAGILGEIHYKNIIHKNINPKSIILNRETGTVKITDFSIASMLLSEDKNVDHNIRVDGLLHYISPEQTGRMNRVLDYRTDLYSLGVTYYEMLTGEVPFRTEDPMELIHSHIAKTPLSPHEVSSEIPLVISDIVMKLLSKNAEDRYRSALGLRYDLLQCHNQISKYGEIFYFPIGMKDRSDRFHIPQKLYGREEQIRLLMEGFEQIRAGQSELTLVTGYSGIGKSVLVKELYKPITGTNGYFISGKYVQFNRNVPYSAIIEALRDLIKQLLKESEHAIEVWKRKILEVVESNGQIIIDVIPEVEYIIGKQNPVPDLPSLEAQNRFKNVYKKFINVFAQQDHPVVIFIDDLQWADSASLSMIKALMTDTDSRYLYLIGAYRDNEVSFTHPLTLILNEIEEENNKKITKIILESLSPDDVKEMVVDAFECTDKSALGLSELIYEKTKGNPFFINRFLKTLYEDGLLWFDLKNEYWVWDVNQIKEQAIMDNVVELMIGNIKKLTPETQNVIKLASCIGNRFSIKMLSLINGKSSAMTLYDVREAIMAGLILPREDVSQVLYDVQLMNDDEEETGNLEATFLHDRVREAAYMLFSEKEKEHIHLQLGRLLIANSPPEEIEYKIFDIVNHLNLGRSLISREKEKDRLIALNLTAGLKAKRSLAYKAAIEFFSVGIELSSVDCWETNYQQTVDLYLGVYECTNLVLDYNRAETYFEIILKHANNVLDKARAYEIKLFSLKAQHLYEDVLLYARHILKELGYSFPGKTRFLHIGMMLVIAKFMVFVRGYDSLLSAPYAEESDHVAAALKIITDILPTVYIIDQNLYAYFLLKMTYMSYQVNKVNYLTPYIISGYSSVHSIALQEYATANKFARLSEQLMEKIDVRNTKQKILFVHNSFVVSWKRHIRETIKPLLNCIRVSLDVGDWEFYAFGVLFWFSHIYLITPSLESIQDQAIHYRESIKKYKQFQSLNDFSAILQFITNLMKGGEDASHLRGEYLDDEEAISVQYKNKDHMGLAQIFTMKAMLSYLYGEYDAANQSMEKSLKFRSALDAQVILAQNIFFHVLILAALYENASVNEQKRYKKIINKNIKILKNWAEAAPMNFRHKYDLALAEKLRLDKKNHAAEERYESAIHGARENGYTMDGALANELYSRYFILKGDREKATGYMSEAYSSYRGWGAEGKLAMMEEKYPEYVNIVPVSTMYPIVRNSDSSQDRTITGEVSDGMLDVDTVLKAYQAISGEILLENILGKMLQILIENAGATRGVLILKNEDKLVVEAEINIENKPEPVIKSVPVELRNDLPNEVINYVARTGDNVVLHDAINEGEYIYAPYMKSRMPRSVLCAPLIYLNKIIGMLYLENNITTAAFTEKRVELLKVLSTQTAISIENAKLVEILTEQERLKQEMEIAERIQTALAPATPQHEDLDIAAVMKPAEKVGGDYYDIIYDKENRIWLAIGDVMGHGVTPGMVMLMTQTSYSSNIRGRQNLTPRDAVITVNEVLYDNICNRLNENLFMTLCLLRYDGDGTFTYSGLHLVILIYRSKTKTIETVPTDGMLMFIFEDISEYIKENTLKLEEGDVMILFTDGIVEAQNAREEMLEMKRFQKLVLDKGEGTAEEIKNHIYRETMSWCNQKPLDDITMIVVKRKRSE